MNMNFKEYLSTHDLHLTEEVTDEGTIYSGLFEISDGVEVPFGIIINEIGSLINFQVVFSELASFFYKEIDYALDRINDLNRQGQGYYHLFLENDGQVHLRTVGLTKDYEIIYQILFCGARTASQVYPALQEKGDMSSWEKN